MLRRDVLTLWLAARHPATPLRAKLLAAAIAAYGLSPIDLIPDFIPVLGYIDDLVLLPVGIWLTVRLIPVALLRTLRAEAEALVARPTSRGMAVLILLIWVAGALAMAWWFQDVASRPI
tara:strand:+ start:298 stop:654 length:357 start_codon:yes stop_codon:yes gene_type:complete